MYLSVLTWNVWRPPLLGRDNYLRGERLVETIKDADPDVVLLQEVFKAGDRRRLLEKLDGYHKPANTYHERSLCGLKFNATGGLATLSRYPILDSQFSLFSDNGKGIAEWFSQKGYAKTVIDTPEGAVRVVDQHICSMSYNETIRLQQLRQMLNDPDITSEEMPVILAGDFNFDIASGNGASGPQEFRVLKEAGFDDGLEGCRDSMRTFCQENRYTKADDMKDLGGNAMLDGIFYRAGGNRTVRTIRSGLVGEHPEVSDHFGVQSVLEIKRV